MATGPSWDTPGWHNWTLPSDHYQAEAVRRLLAANPGMRNADVPYAGQEPLSWLYNGGNTWAAGSEGGAFPWSGSGNTWAC